MPRSKVNEYLKSLSAASARMKAAKATGISRFHPWAKQHFERHPSSSDDPGSCRHCFEDYHSHYNGRCPIKSEQP